MTLNTTMTRDSSFKTVLAALVLVLLSAGSARAAPAGTPVFSGAELLKMCNSAHDTDYGFCAGYVNAVGNLMLTESIAEHRACKHQLVRSQQEIEIFRGYAELFPEMMAGEAATAVAASLERAFPCGDR